MSVTPRSRLPLGTLLVAAAFTLLVSSSVRAQGFSGAGSCPPGNLLAGKRPIHWQDIRGQLPLVTNGEVAPEGAIWDAPVAVVLDRGSSVLTYDLGSTVALQAIYMQADANDTYHFWGSTDGQNFHVVGRAEPVEGVHGLRARRVSLGGQALRFLRVGEGVGDDFYSISELQAFCQVPNPYPPDLKVVAAAPAVVKKTIYDYWNNDASSRWELALGVLGFLVLWWEWKSRGTEGNGDPPGASVTAKDERPALRRVGAVGALLSGVLFWKLVASGLGNIGILASFLLALAGGGLAIVGWTAVRCWKVARAGRPRSYRKLRDRALMLLGMVSFFTYFNFGFFHFPNSIHDWEWTHYYVGSKYFKELGYDKLYECIAIADVEEGLRRRVELRKLTNLRNNALETTADILAHPERCKSGFSEARWSGFKRDVRFFRDRQSARRWDDLQTDHGYNGTPVWNIAGTLLANLGPANVSQLYALAVIDPLYLVAMVGVIWWAFGWRVTCIGLIAFATNFPSRFYWTGGAFLRWDWLFYLVASVCLLRKGRPTLAGLSLGYATLLRIFPMFMFVGPLLAAAWPLVRERRLAALDRRWINFFAGAALSVALLIPASFHFSGGVGAYRQFIHNTVKHKETPLTNYMGLRTVVAYRPSEAGRHLRNDALTDPWKKWKDARLRAYSQARPLYVVLILAYVALLALAVRRREPWEAVALSATFIAVGVELTCYYYAFVIAVALLSEKDEWVGRVLVLATAFTGFVDWRPLQGMPGWLDEQYTLMSVGTLVAFVAIVWKMGPGPLLAAYRGVPLVAAAPAAAEPVAPPVALDGGSDVPGRKRKKRR